MKQFFIIFVIFIFFIAIIIGNCNDENYYDDDNEDESTEIVLPQRFISNETENVNISTSATIDTMGSTTVTLTALQVPRLVTSMSEQILVRVGYIASYNNKTKNANWVAWHLTKEHTSGPWSREGIPYKVDTDVKGARQELDDWDDITLPVDHGHLCPAGDNKWSKEAMEQSFLLTNMCPQNSSLNRGDWDKLENRCRGWANHYGEVFIVAGPIFYSQNYKTIGNKVGVPDAFFKVVLRMTKKPQALGFVFPNDGVHHKLPHYVYSVDEVEQITGIDFFYNLPDDIEDLVESQSNFSIW